MTITNNNNQYVKIESDFLSDFLSAPEDYSGIKITANIKRCTGNVSDDTLAVSEIGTELKWFAELAAPVSLNTLIQELSVQNMTSLEIFNVLTVPVDLAYISANCPTQDCTLETFDAHFAGIIKPAIDNWFASKGITSNVIVAFTDNTMAISNLPDGFTMYSVLYGTVPAYTEILCSFSVTGGKVFISGEAIYLHPSLFEDTTLQDGIYNITIRYTKTNNGFVQESNCAFIDVNIKCKVADYISAMLAESDTALSEKVGTTVHIMHYGLVNGSNCGCNCNDLCTLYGKLIGILNNQNTQDCGC